MSGFGPGTVPVSGPRPVAAARLDRLARLTVAALIMTMPFRLRIDPLPHPATGLPAPLADVVVYAIDGLIAVTLGAWLVARVVDRRRIRLGPRAIALPALALLGLAWLTLPFGVMPSLSLFGAVRLTVLLCLALYVVNEVDGPAALAVPIALMLGIQGVVAVAQFLHQGSIGLAAIGETRLGPDVPGVAVVLREDGVRVLRAYGLSTHPNVLGGFFAAGLLLLLAWRPGPAPSRLLQLGVVAVAVAGLVVTFSRGAWLGAAVGLVVGLVLVGRRSLRGERRHWLAVGGAALAVALAAGWQLRGELAVRSGLATAETATERRSVDERMAQIELGLRVLATHPVLGVGMSAVPLEMQRLDPAFPWSFYPPHLVPLAVADELGIGGGLAFLFLATAPWVLLLHRRRAWEPELAAASGALAAVLVAGLVDDYPWVGGPGRTLFWVVLALWVAALGRASSRAEAVA
ncbi:MAG: O-antigen ligase family protein [Chloroflexi bacterium]|nr:O-antigen ligase family protein [Chloroflexota bacterium]